MPSARVETEPRLPFQPVENDKPETVSSRDAAAQAGVTQSTINKWAATGRIERHTSGQIVKASLDHYLQQRARGLLAPARRSQEARSAQDLGPPTRLNITQAARAVGVPRTTLQEVVKRGDVPLDDDGLVPLTALVQAGYTFLDPALVPQPAPKSQAPVTDLELTGAEDTHLREIIRFLQQELADAKAEKAKLLAILEGWRTPPRYNAAQRFGPRRSPRTAPAEPKAPLQWQRILQYILESPRPKRAWQVQRDLGLEVDPSRDLKRLVDRKLIVRLTPGVFAAPGQQLAAAEVETQG